MRSDSQTGMSALPSLSTQTSRSDDWENVYSGLGGVKDKRLGVQVVAARRFMREELSEMYRGSDVVATIIDLPADEMTREWMEFTSVDDADNEVQAAVMDFLDGANDGPDEEQGLQTRKAFHECAKWSRLFGGAAIVMGINDGQPSDKALNYERIQSVDFLNVLDRFSLRPFRYYEDPLARKYGQVEIYQLTNSGSSTPEASTRYVHESRILRMDGVTLPPREMRQQSNYGWGDSIMTRVWEVVRDYAAVWMNFSYLLGDAAQTTIKIKGLASALSSPNGRALIASRMEAIEMCRSIARAVLLDEGEDFSRDVANLSGLPEAMQKFIERLAQAARMPIELLMGQPPGGLNGNGETGMRYWYSQIGAMQERMMRAPLMKLIRIVLASKNGPTKGIVPERWTVDFKPLGIPTQAEKADIYAKVATAAAALVYQGILDPEEAANSHFGTSKLQIDVTLDKEMRDKMTELGPTPEEKAEASRAVIAAPIADPAENPEEKAATE